jgi:hypothetical protein
MEERRMKKKNQHASMRPIRGISNRLKVSSVTHYGLAETSQIGDRREAKVVLAPGLHPDPHRWNARAHCFHGPVLAQNGHGTISEPIRPIN